MDISVLFGHETHGVNRDIKPHLGINGKRKTNQKLLQFVMFRTGNARIISSIHTCTCISYCSVSNKTDWILNRKA
jgi:hypothetical protein